MQPPAHPDVLIPAGHTRPPIRLIPFPAFIPTSASEQRADRELKYSHALRRPGIEIDPVGRA
jgi:hypothetical protein